MTVLELAKQYYPRLWDESRINALVEAGRLTEEEAKEILDPQEPEETVVQQERRHRNFTN